MFKNKARPAWWKKKKWYSKTRAPSTRKLQRTKASKRFNWVTLLDTTCDVQFLPPRACEEVIGGGELTDVRPVTIDCETGEPVDNPAQPSPPVQFQLVIPSTSVGGADLYGSDDITVVRMVGQILLQPFWVMRAPALAIHNAAPAHNRAFILETFRKDRNLFMRAGLKKEEWFWDEVNQIWGIHPRDPFNTEEWSEVRWQRRWTFERLPGSLGGHTGEVAAPGTEIGVCSRVTGTGGGTSGVGQNQFVDGTGTVNIDPIDIDTECETVSNVFAATRVGTWTVPDRPLRLSLSSRKRLRFRENEGMVIWLNYSTLDFSQEAGPLLACQTWSHDLAVGFAVRAHVKALIET